VSRFFWVFGFRRRAGIDELVVNPPLTRTVRFDLRIQPVDATH